MLIDLNKLPHTQGESLPDLNKEPADQQEEEDQAYLQVHLQGDQPLPDLNEGPKHEQDEEGQIYLHLQQGQPLPDLNEGPEHEQDEEGQVYLQVHLQQDQPLPDLNEQPTHDQEETNHLQEVQSQHLMEDEHVVAYGVNLNVDASMGEQQPHEDMEDEDMHDYGVYTDVVAVDFNEDELDSSDFEEYDYANDNDAHQFRNLTDDERQQIYAALLERSDRGRLKKKSTTIVAQMFQVSRYRVQRIWQRAKQCRSQGRPVDVRSRKPKNCGRKKIQVDLSEVLNIPLRQRSTIRSLAGAIGVKKSTLHRWFKEGLLRRHSSTLKPLLTEENKKERLQWCVSMLDRRTLPNEPKFIEMDNIIHMDEKWFNTTSKYKKYYMLRDEDDPNRTVRNKNSVGKVMFLSAVARPIYDDAGNCIFDGKLGVWPFVRKESAKKRSRNRERGTQVTKPIKVDRKTMRSYLISKVLKAIVERWPREHARKPIFIQQDNAPSHVPVNDEEFAAAVAQTGLDIQLVNQPANSPDLNVLDLGFFASLQSLTNTTISRNLDDLIANVQREFAQYNPSTLNRVFLTLQGCLIEVMKDGGGNRYKIPHIYKDRLEAEGMLPKSLSCDRQLYENVMASLGV